MRRNSARRILQETERIAARATTTVADQARGSASETTGSSVGGTDDAGEWQPYGRLDVTPLSEFRLA